jgi:hypothetical protein
MLLAVLKQQFLGVINLACPLLIIALVWPTWFFSPLGAIVSALLVGFYVYYLNYKAARNQASALQFVPSGIHGQEFERCVHECGINPQVVRMRYGYCNESMAMALFNTILVDPLVWQGIDDDPEALKAMQVLEHYIIPTLSETQKVRIQKVNEILTAPAQRFIIKHEVGHVVAHYSHMKLVLVGVIGACAAYTGILAARWALSAQVPGVVALIVGIVVGGIIDLGMSYASNALFKARQEKEADIFAVEHSSVQEIMAAADFFEHYQAIIDEHPFHTGFLAKIPTTLLTGYCDGRDRAQYLRAMAIDKETKR